MSADKVKYIAFAVCSAFLFGDHLAFTANFQPTRIVPVMAGKLFAGLTAVGLTIWLSVPMAIKIEQEMQG
ncbi:Ethanolamine utilisation protein, EutH [Halanaerobium congolense]|jgi:ethanolamine transporter|nr:MULTISPECIES: ethanolamine utilization protein EutH [Clostridia]SDH21229.1 Ethanolamine utilisation protein, EutH [Halanaerobium congolense]SHM68892.1 Ethanolamine utilisation protein, EutH [Halanaerobium congolense]